MAVFLWNGRRAVGCAGREAASWKGRRGFGEGLWIAYQRKKAKESDQSA